MMFIPILLLILSHVCLGDLMTQSTIPESVPMPNRDETAGSVPQGEPEIFLKPKESVRVSTDDDFQTPAQVPNEVRLEERSPPGRLGVNCIDRAVSNLPEVGFSVKVPKLGINFEVSEFPSLRLILTNLADKVKSIPFMRSLGIPNEFKRIQIRSIGEVDVHISIPKFGWLQTLKLSDVISGFDLPKIPNIAPKVESCVGECVAHH
nr:viral suppressor of RNA silencing [Prunus virus I]